MTFVVISVGPINEKLNCHAQSDTFASIFLKYFIRILQFSPDFLPDIIYSAHAEENTHKKLRTRC